MRRTSATLLGLVLLCVPLASSAAAPEGPAGIAARSAGLARHEGFLAWYWDERKGQLLIEISKWDEPFLYSAGLSTGAGTIEASLDRGQLGTLALCRFRRVGPRVLLIEDQTGQRSGVADSERSRVIAESFPVSVLGAFPIVAESGSQVLVDATEFLLRDTQVAPELDRGGEGKWSQDPARSAFALERSGAFPRNTEIEALLTFSCDKPAADVAAVLPDGHTLSVTVHHTFLALPEPGYTPRAADPRVGYFTQSFRDHAAPFTEPLERALICRWRLEKKDPQAALSDPVQPIVYYLDRGMPEPERSTVRAAALWWNRAFEQAGFQGAIVIRDLPPGATFLDARYSGIQWTSRAERAWSIGQSQTDPRTGEILHAVVILDSHRRRTTSRIWQDLAPPSPRGAGLARCRAADAAESAFDDPNRPESTLVLARLAYLSAHEVGHTLGLEHNMAATTFGWGSVMDYLAPHVMLREGRFDLSDAYPRDIGEYDRVAIRWGYEPHADAASLDRMVREAQARGAVYPHPSDARWNEYDWGKDPIVWLPATMEVRREMLRRFGVAQLRSGEPLYDLQHRFSLAYLYHRYAILAAQRAIGGRYVSNALAGDGQVPIAAVPAAKQREALEDLLEALAPAALAVPANAASALVPAPSTMEPTRERFASEAGDLFSPLTAARVLAGLIVRPLLDPERAARLTLAQGVDALTFDRLLARLIAATWGVGEGAERSELRALRHIGQRVTLDAMLELAARKDAAPEVRGAVLARLEALRADLARRNVADPAFRAHVRLAARDLAEFLDRPETRTPRPPAPPVPPGRPIAR